MSRTPENEALEKIQEIADLLPVEYDLPEEVRECLRIIADLARHHDNPSCVDTTLLDKMKRRNR
jgi:hypothetical protein